MKKLFTLLSFALIAGTVSAQQSLTITDHDPDVYVPADPADIKAEYKNHVNNVTNNIIRGVTERTIITRATGHSLAVCWGNICTFDSTNTVDYINANTQDSILPNDYNATLKGQVYPQGNAGMTRVKYCIQDVNDANDSVCVVVTFDIFVGLEEHQNALGTVGNAYPNPSSTVTELGYDLNPDIKKREVKVYNASGVLVHQDVLPYANGVFRIRSSELAAGVYFFHVIGDDAVIATRKFMVRK